MEKSLLRKIRKTRMAKAMCPMVMKLPERLLRHQIGLRIVDDLNKGNRRVIHHLALIPAAQLRAHEIRQNPQRAVVQK